MWVRLPSSVPPAAREFAELLLGGAARRLLECGREAERRFACAGDREDSTDAAAIVRWCDGADAELRPAALVARTAAGILGVDVGAERTGSGLVRALVALGPSDLRDRLDETAVALLDEACGADSDRAFALVLALASSAGPIGVRRLGECTVIDVAPPRGEALAAARAIDPDAAWRVGRTRARRVFGTGVRTERRCSSRPA